MNRYITSNTLLDSNGKRRLGTTLFPTFQTDPSDLYIRTTSIERLDKLALRFYADPTAWPIIASANNIGKGTLVVPVNTRLRIPNIADVQQYLTNINLIR
jgi:hypothetical protein